MSTELLTTTKSHYEPSTASLLANVTAQSPDQTDAPIFMTGGVHGDLLTDLQRQDVEMILDCGIRYAIAIVGVFTNVVSVIVLGVQGLKDTVNMALFALSMTDLAYLLTGLSGQVFCSHLRSNRELANSMRQEFVPQGIMLGIAFSRLSSAITALISVERCICVTLPLKVQRLVTYRCTLITIIAIVVILCSLFVPVLMILEVQYFDTGHNTTVAFALPTPFLINNITFMSVLVDTILSVAIPVSLLAVVVASTTLTVLQLKLSSRWRKASSSSSSTTSKNQSNETDEKTARLTRMMVAIACVYIVCIIPGTVATIVRLFIPEFNLNRKYHNTFAVVYAVDFTLQTANASVNFFVYIIMSSRFRQVFLSIIRRVCGGRSCLVNRGPVGETHGANSATGQTDLTVTSVAELQHRTVS